MIKKAILYWKFIEYKHGSLFGLTIILACILVDYNGVMLFVQPFEGIRVVAIIIGLAVMYMAFPSYGNNYFTERDRLRENILEFTMKYPQHEAKFSPLIGILKTCDNNKQLAVIRDTLDEVKEVERKKERIVEINKEMEKLKKELQKL
jgi:hypothetical protein